MTRRNGVSVWLSILIVLVTVYLCFFLQGCASPDVQCDMRVDYDHEVPMASDGTVLLNWHFDRVQPPTLYGHAECIGGNCTVYLKERASFHDVCSLARFGHEVAHALGAVHSK
ncbi:MAG TPA: hypothetical protein VHV32_19050 [Candidatus Angelobacter sp.]|jgi:hypothetical protein|nr:hypothetical protein [Candidatus Angelobacter sp.]